MLIILILLLYLYLFKFLIVDFNMLSNNDNLMVCVSGGKDSSILIILMDEIRKRAEIDFKLPVHYNDEIKIFTRCLHIGNKSFSLEYKLVKNINGTEIILTTCSTVVVMYNYEINSSIAIPEIWKEKLKKFEEIL